MKYAVIGTGWITQSYIDGANLAGNQELCAVYSRTEEKGRAFADKNGVDTVFTSLDELLSCDADALYIASPNSFHTRQSELALKAGKSVICEKPVAINPSRLEYLQKLACENNLTYVEAIMYMFSPVRKLLAEAVSKIGNIHSAHFDFSQLSSKYEAYMSGKNPNIFNPEFATGGLEDLGIYCVYPAVDLFGVPENVKASAWFMESGADGCGSASLDYKDKIVTVTWSKVGQNFNGSRIFGDKGTIFIDSVSKLTDIYIIYNDGSREDVWGDTEKAVLMCNEAAGFADIIDRKPGSREKYAELREMSLNVCKVLERIREEAGIVFRCNDNSEV